MSEYQYYEFLAVDRPLTASEMADLRQLSTRAEITSTSLVNTYNWGDFQGDPKALVEQYFDAFLYFANWGTRELMIRLPATVLDPDTAQAYCGDEAATSWTSGDHTVLSFSSDPEAPGDWEEDTENWLTSIIPSRSELEAGDHRLLYLGWLLAAQAGGLDDEAVEPVVPPGLGRLSGSLQRFAQFMRLDDDLIEVAARASAELVATTVDEAELMTWVAELPVRQKDDLLVAAIRGRRPQLGVELMRRFRVESRQNEDAMVGDDHDEAERRTVAELLHTADTFRLERERAEAERQEQEQARRERARAEAVAKRREALAAQGEDAWIRVGQLIGTKKPTDYDAAVAILVDLQAISRGSDRFAAFTDRLRQVREQHARKPSLIARLDQAGLTGA